MEWPAVVKFQYNDKKHAAMEQILFVLNFGRHPQKGNPVVQTEFPKLKEFLMKLQRNRKEATKSMEIAQGIMKKQFDKK